MGGRTSSAGYGQRSDMMPFTNPRASEINPPTKRKKRKSDSVEKKENPRVTE